MTTYAIDKVIRCTTDWSLANGGLAQNVFHMATPATCVQSDVNAAASLMSTLYTATFGGFRLMGAISEDVVASQVIARTVDPANPLEHNQTVGENGDQTSEPLPLETSGVTTFYSDLASRRGRGRTFLPGIAVVESDNGIWLEASRAVINGVYEDWIASIVADATPMELVVWSPTASQARTVNGVITRPIFHHQRRRNS